MDEMVRASQEQARRPAGEGPKIDFSPGRQILHGPSQMRVIIEDRENRENRENREDGKLVDSTPVKLLVHYNGLDISQSFLARSKVRRDPQTRRIVIENPSIRLDAGEDHQIEVAYRSQDGHYAYARYEAPSCYLFRPRPVLRLGKFAENAPLARVIDRISRAKGINPSLSTGLIAQESGFNPEAVSWAKALGLTQVTPVAEVEILKSYEDWPRYPGLNSRSAREVRALVEGGLVNARNEWRLDQELSIRGGLQYLAFLDHQWSSPENQARIQALFPDPEIAQTQLILASYHSGYTRVQSALNQEGRQWLHEPELGEARKYVNKIFSFCEFFSDRELDL